MEKRSTSSQRSEVTVLTIQFDTPKVTSFFKKSQCPKSTPTVGMITSFLFLVLAVL
ncbi:hypothetical protein DPMN_041641 [Dreissena polymorpha]|uniref:Uncharacterized protein n=1 Tax=Dreissena polymorpha TaxID=45954 RepID=A0A9D4CZ18_DREPO|nr:hypothetical protein DPMN_041641 [Dreissena polymorpha]